MDKERRKFKRFDAYMSVKYKSTPATPQEVEGISLSKDLCREGLRINSDSAISQGAVLDLEINIPDDPKSIVTSGRVMWARPSEGSNQGFDHGVRILSMDPVDKFRVLDYAYNHWLETKVNDFSNLEEDIEEIG